MSIDKIKPEILDEGFAVCHKDCPSFGKDEKSDKVLPSVLCESLQKAPVRPRTICIPWSKFLLRSNKAESDAILKLSQQMKKDKEDFQAILDKRNADIEQMQKEGLHIRTEFGKSLKLIEGLAVEKAQLNEDVIIEDLLRQHQWGELKKVQAFRKNRKRHVERLKKAVDERDELRLKVKTLNAENSRLLQEDVSKAGIIKNLEAKTG